MWTNQDRGWSRDINHSASKLVIRIYRPIIARSRHPISVSCVKLACHQQLSIGENHIRIVLLLCCFVPQCTHGNGIMSQSVIRGVAQKSAYTAQNCTKVTQNSSVVFPLKAVSRKLTYRIRFPSASKSPDHNELSELSRFARLCVLETFISPQLVAEQCKQYSNWIGE